MQYNKTFTTSINDVTVTASFTDLAEKADGSVLITADDTVVFVTAVMADQETSKDYFPLSVEFEERFYSVGAILGSRFLRREGRPSQEAVLNARIIDRTIRPLFPKGFHNEVQVIATVLSFGRYNPDVLAVLGASLALGTSSIPWNGPVSAVRYVRTTNGWQAFAPFDDAKHCTDMLLLCGKKDCITMIEMEGSEVPEDTILQVSDEALKTIAELQTFQQSVIDEIGKEKISFGEQKPAAETIALFDKHIRPALENNLFSEEDTLDTTYRSWKKIIAEQIDDATERRLAEVYFEDMATAAIHAEAVVHGRRADGRGIDEVRPLYAQAGGISPRLHGTGIFYRGGTHVFTALTLGSPKDALALNTVEDPDTNERFMHHYNFPLSQPVKPGVSADQNGGK